MEEEEGAKGRKKSCASFSAFSISVVLMFVCFSLHNHIISGLNFAALTGKQSEAIFLDPLGGI